MALNHINSPSIDNIIIQIATGGGDLVAAARVVPKTTVLTPTKEGMVKGCHYHKLHQLRDSLEAREQVLLADVAVLPHNEGFTHLQTTQGGGMIPSTIRGGVVYFTRRRHGSIQGVDK